MRSSPLSRRQVQSRTYRTRLLLEPLEDRILLDGNVLVNNPAHDTTTRDTQSETTLVVFGSTVVVGFNDSGSSAVSSTKFTGWSRSTDGGVTFTDLRELPTNPAGDGGDPVMARDEATGTIYFATLSTTGVINVFRSTDGGATFAAPVNATPGFSTPSQDKEWLTVDNFAGSGRGNVYLVASNFGSPAGVFLLRSTDGGATFGPGGGVSIATNSSAHGAFVVVGPDHSVYAFWYENFRIMMRKSTDQGQTFGAAVLVTNLLTRGSNGALGLGFRSNAFPHAAVNPVSGAIYVVYNDNPAGSDRADVYVRQSTDAGATWGAAVKVNDDDTTRDQWQPTLAVTPNGSKLGIFWYDRRLDAANNLIDRFGAIATLSGSAITFAQPNFRITDVSFAPRFNQDPAVNSTYMGDYDQAVADNSFFYVTWGDNRLPGTGTVHPDGQPDVRFSKIALNSIAGVKFNDLNSNGVRDTGEPGIAGWTVYLDLNNNAALDSGEPSTVTGVLGDYFFGSLALGTYVVREVLVSGWVQTAPAAGFHSVSVVSSSEQITGRDFGNRLVNPATIAGAVFHDLNGDGVRQTAEPGLSGWTVFLDANGNAVLDSSELFATTDSSGNYSISGLPGGTHTVREVLQTNWSRTLPAAPGTYTVTLAAGATVSGRDFGNRSGTITGTSYRDNNRNGVRDTGEAGLPGWTIYLDLNNNAALDASEPRQFTDAQGNYTFSGLAAGTYVVREVVQSNWLQTAPAGGSYSAPIVNVTTLLTGRDFGNAQLASVRYIASGADAGGGPHVKVFDAATGTVRFEFFAYGATFTGGVRVAVGDVNGDGVPDIITAAGASGGPHVRIFDGGTGAPVGGFFAYGASFTGGVFVAAGDVNGDGKADIITAPGAGGGAMVRIFSGADSTLLREFAPYAAGFAGAVTVAAGDINADGRADIVTAPASDGGPHIRAFSGADGALLREFLAYSPSFLGGVFVALGDVDGDGRADIITSAGAGGGPHVKVTSGASGAVLSEFFAYGASFTGGVRVAAVDRDGDGRAEVVTAPGPGLGPNVRLFNGLSTALINEFFAYDSLFAGGVFVGGR